MAEIVRKFELTNNSITILNINNIERAKCITVQNAIAISHLIISIICTFFSDFPSGISYFLQNCYKFARLLAIDNNSAISWHINI